MREPTVDVLDGRIPPSVHEFLVLDLGPLLAVTLAAGALALAGSFLVLRRQAMLGDAMAHAVLPGLIAAFWVTGARDPVPMFAGALIAAGVTSLLVGIMTRVARVEPSTAIGVAFTSMFALGVLLVEVTGSRNVDLDLDCVLSGQLELLFWNAPSTWNELLQPETLATLPRPVWTVALLFLIAACGLAATWRLVRVATFDSPYAMTRGLSPHWIRGAMLTLTTGIVVACFDALGSILVIALLTCPPAAARLLTRSLGAYVVLATLLGILAGLVGYGLATSLAPRIIGHAVDASGSVAVVAGSWLCIAAVVSASRSSSGPAPS